MLIHPGSLLPQLMGLLIMGLCTHSAQAGYYVLNHNATNMNPSTGSAIAVAMPSVDNGRIQINRIRLSSSKSTALNFLFRSFRATSSLGDTESFVGWTCSLPGCQDVYAIEGVKAGHLYDMGGLELTLQPGNRLYLYSSATIGSDAFTVEVWWNDR